MLHRLARLFSIPSGEERRTFLLFLMYLLFFVGLRWGDSASRTLFQLSWGDLLAVIFLISAPLAFLGGLSYSYFAGRVSNERLLRVILGLMIVWLISVQVLLAANLGTGAQGVTYLYFFLGTLVIVDVVALHLLNYINDFYNTRSAKQALPFILSASIAGSVVAGFSAPVLNGLIGLTAMPLAWAACLLGIFGLAYVARREMPPALVEIEQQRQQRRTRTNVFSDFRNDARLLGQLDILRWLAISTLALVLLMKLLTIQSATIFNQIYAGNPQGLFNVYNVLDAVFSLIGLLFSSLVFNRLIVRYGVGNMSLVFPSITVGIVAAINFLPQPAEAIAGVAYLDDRAFKKVFRNPIEAMFYNSVPLNIKARARAVINSIMLPLGTLLAGLLGLATAKGLIAPSAAAWLSLMLALLYLGVSWLVKNAYSHALIRLVATDELAVFRSGYGEQEEFDPLLVRRLAQRLRTNQDDDNTTIILAAMLYDFQGRAALHDLCHLAEQRSGSVRASLIQLLADWIEDPLVRQLSLTGLSDSDVRVRRAATAALAADPTAAHDRTIVDRFLEVVRQPDEFTQSQALPILIASGDLQGAAASQRILAAWLGDADNAQHRALGLQVLARTGDARFIDQVAPYLQDHAAVVRVQAVDLIGALALHTDQPELRQASIETLHRALQDEDVSVRLEVVNNLGLLNGVRDKATQLTTGHALLDAMCDDRFRVRRAACQALRAPIRREVEQVYRAGDERVAECALYVMARVGSKQIGGTLVHKRVTDRCEELAERWYAVQTYRTLLTQPATPAMQFLDALVLEQANRLVKRIFWLLGALYGEQDIETVRRSLRSSDPRARANALESLEALGTTRLAELITPMFTTTDRAAWAKIAHERLKQQAPELADVFNTLWPTLSATRSVREPIERSELLTAAAMYAVTDVAPVGEQAWREQMRAALDEASHSEVSLWRETAVVVLSKLTGTADKEHTMLTLIEKMVFLKQVQFFDEMPANDLRAVAQVAEEASYEAGQSIIAEGEQSDALYIVVSGRVAVQHRKRAETERTLTELATLGRHEYFGEMSLFDEAPGSADVVALVPAQVLLVRRAPLFALLERQPALAMDLFRVLSRRLRQANELLVKRGE